MKPNRGSVSSDRVGRSLGRTKIKGYAYSFPVPELTPGVSYCFRLDEIAVDGSARRIIIMLCGLGYGVTPTPRPLESGGAGVVEDSRLRPRNAHPRQHASLPQDVAGPPTSTPTVIPVNNSPLPTPTSYTDGSLDSPSPNADGSTGPDSIAQAPGSVDVVDGSADTTSTEPPPSAPTELPDPGYIVVTATPTSEAVAQLMPTFTPLPTATMQPENLMAQLADLNAENLALATLCFVFFGATGIGILGITSLGLYFRSRSDDGRR